MNKSANNENSVFEQMFENTAILTVKDDNNVVWFKGKDVCIVLGYKEPANAIQYSVEKEDKKGWKTLKTMVGKNPSIKITYQTVFINESGVNALVMRSKKPNAKKFQHWITSEVIPSIRTKGYYIHKERKSTSLVDEHGYAHFTTVDAVQDDSRKEYLQNPYYQKVNITDIDKINKLLKRGDDIDFYDYEDEHVLYFYATSIKNLHDDRMILKFGYTNDIIARNKQLKKVDYKSEMRIVGIKRIGGQGDEKRFHNTIKEHYPALQYKCKIIKGKNNPKIEEKTELYYYSPKLVSLFDKWEPRKERCDSCKRMQLILDVEKEDNQDCNKTIKIKDEQIWLLQQKNALLEEELAFMKEKEAFYKMCSEIDNL